MNYFSEKELRFLLTLIESHIEELAHHGATTNIEIEILKQKIYYMVIAEKKNMYNEKRRE